MRLISAIFGFSSITTRAISRSAAFRWLLALTLVCTILTASVFPPFLFFADGRTNGALLASNTFLWSMLYAFFVLPQPAARLAGREATSVHYTTRVTSWEWAIGRLLGSLVPFLLGGLLIVGVGSGLSHLLGRGHTGGFTLMLVFGSLSHLLVGVVAICGVAVLAQAENAALAAVGGALWFALGSQKSTLLADLGDGATFAIASVCAAWLPDSVALFDNANADNPSGTSIGSQLGYGMLFCFLNVALAVIWIELRSRNGAKST